MQLRKIAGILINVTSLCRILKHIFCMYAEFRSIFVFFLIFRASLNINNILQPF